MSNSLAIMGVLTSAPVLAADEDIDVRRDLPAGGPTAAEAKKLETRGATCIR